MKYVIFVAEVIICNIEPLLSLVPVIIGEMTNCKKLATVGYKLYCTSVEDCFAVLDKYGASAPEEIYKYYEIAKKRIKELETEM